MTIAELLSGQILEGRIPPGRRLPSEAELMRTHQASRTIVREAISHLQGRGLVTTLHGVGTFVSGDYSGALSIQPKFHADDLAWLREVEVGVGTEVAALAASRRTRENLEAMRNALFDFQVAIQLGTDPTNAEQSLHAELAYATHSPLLRDLHLRVIGMLLPHWRMGLARYRGEDRLARMNRLYMGYEGVVSAVDERDGESARAGLRMLLADRNCRDL